MMQTKNLQSECQHCRGMFEFQADAAGTTAACPHCGQPTEMMPALPADAASPMRTKAVVFTVIALVILLGGLVGTVLALKRAQRITHRQQQTLTQATSQTPPKTTGPFAASGFAVSTVTLEKGQANSLLHAVGTITNTANRQRFGLRVELDLLDEAGNKIGSATDYRPTLEPGLEWRFRALVVEKKAALARVVAIKEDQ